MGKKKKLKQKQAEERSRYLIAMYACLGIVGLSSHIATKVEGWSFAYWISLGVIVIFGTTLLVLLNRMLRLDEEQEKRLK
jgi:uncharacterized membrane protein